MDACLTPYLLPPLQFKFRVDEVWKTSPCDTLAADSSGNYNHQVVVTPNVQLTWPHGGSQVYVVGDFTGWVEAIPLTLDEATQVRQNEIGTFFQFLF